MNSFLSLEDFLLLAKNSGRIAVYQDISADRLTPIGIIEQLSTLLSDGAVLESGLNHQHDEGRYSYISFGKLASLKVLEQKVIQTIGDTTTIHNIHPFTALRKLLKEMAPQNAKYHDIALHSAIGYVAYDAIRLFEKIPEKYPNTNKLPDLEFNFYQNTLVFDHLKQQLRISISTEVAADGEKTYHSVREQITNLINKITTQNYPKETHKNANFIASEGCPDIPDHEFMELVLRAKQHIIDGDAFQIVLSRCFKTEFLGNPFNIYRALRMLSPAPYMFYLPTEQGIIIGASPEKLISVRNSKIEINPIAGTLRRSKNITDDEITQTLLNNPKEVAEHMMLVDLARNDIGAVCKPESVRVKELLKIKHFSHVSHITSIVSGELRVECDALDALSSTFPAGTLSGAPKIRAMQIIDELETSRRGMYGGAICRIDHLGNFDSCIAIRMALVNQGEAIVRTGAGIVFDSSLEAEANETREKARGVLLAIQYAKEVLA